MVKAWLQSSSNIWHPGLSPKRMGWPWQMQSSPCLFWGFVCLAFAVIGKKPIIAHLSFFCAKEIYLPTVARGAESVGPSQDSACLCMFLDAEQDEQELRRISDHCCHWVIAISQELLQMHMAQVSSLIHGIIPKWLLITQVIEKYHKTSPQVPTEIPNGLVVLGLKTTSWVPLTCHGFWSFAGAWLKRSSGLQDQLQEVDQIWQQVPQQQGFQRPSAGSWAGLPPRWLVDFCGTSEVHREVEQKKWKISREWTKRTLGSINGAKRTCT